MVQRVLVTTDRPFLEGRLRYCGHHFAVSRPQIANSRRRSTLPGWHRRRHGFSSVQKRESTRYGNRLYIASAHSRHTHDVIKREVSRTTPLSHRSHRPHGPPHLRGCDRTTHARRTHGARTDNTHSHITETHKYTAADDISHQPPRASQHAPRSTFPKSTAPPP